MEANGTCSDTWAAIVNNLTVKLLAALDTAQGLNGWISITQAIEPLIKRSRDYLF
jgi:hypothetical protein